MTIIHCTIVDDHCHIVPVIHSLYRRKIVIDSSVPYIYHFDSHCDLSLPPSSVKKWSEKNFLYSLLSEEDGIASFLIPLRYTELIQQIIWIRPQWSSDELQQDGSYKFHIGDIKDSARPSYRCDELLSGSTLKSSYYADDGVLVDEDDLILSSRRECLLTIHTLPIHVTSHGYDSSPVVLSPHVSVRESWVLDICLDFFRVCNPFFPPLFEAIGRDLKSRSQEEEDGQTKSPLIDVNGVMDIIIAVYRQLPYRQPTFINSTHPRVILEERKKSLHTLNLILNEMEPCDIEYRLLSVIPLISLRSSFIQMISLLSIDTRHLISETGLLTLLPHQPLADEDTAIEMFFVQCLAISESHSVKIDEHTTDMSISYQPPSAIFIALSDDDGYTPKAHSLRDKVLDVITNRLCPLWHQTSVASNMKTDQCELVVHDFSDEVDVVDAAYRMFLHKRCRES